MDPPTLEQMAAVADEAVAAAEAASEAANAAPTEAELQALAAAAAAHEAAWARAASAAAAARAAWRAAKDKAVAAKAAKHNAGCSSEAVLEVVLANPVARAALLRSSEHAASIVVGREGRSAVRQVSKLSRATYDAYVTHIDLDAKDFAHSPLDGLRSALACFPQLEDVTLKHTDVLEVVEVLQSAPPLLQRLESLFVDFLKPDNAPAGEPPPNLLPLCELVAASFPRLASLMIFSEPCELCNACALALASPAWPHLNKLSILGCRLSCAGLSALAAAPWAAQLEKLCLSNCGITLGHASIIRDGEWTQVRRLDLSNNAPGFRDAALARVLAAPWIVGLEELVLEMNCISPGPRGAARLLDVPWQRLEYIRLHHQFTEAGQPRSSEEYEEVQEELQALHPALFLQIDSDFDDSDDDGGGGGGGGDE